MVSEGTRDATTTFLIRYAFQTAVYSVWQERNGRRVGEREWSAALLLSRIDKQVRNRISSINRAGPSRLQTAMQLWFGSR